MFKKLNELPKYWVVKCDTNHPDWVKVIDYLDKITGGIWHRRVNGCYYGYDGSKNNERTFGTNVSMDLKNFQNNPVVLTIDEFVKLTSKEIVEIDFTIRGTKLPTILKGTEYCYEKSGSKNTFQVTRGYLVSFGSKLINGEVYVKAESPSYTGTTFWNIKLWDINQLAKKQGMLPKELPPKELPKYWVVKCDTSHSDWMKVIDYLNTIYPNGWTGNGSNYYGYDGSKSYLGTNCWDEISSFENNPTLLTIEEFVELTSKEKIMKKITITREQLEGIYNIACETWKVKIKNIAQEQPFGDITLTQAQVDEMFKAATKDQLPTLEEIFGKPLKELDFRVDINEKVDDLKIFGGLETGHTEAFIVLPADNPKDKNRFYLNPKYNWELKDDELIVTRK